MKLSSCPRCERHIDIDAASCPFCGTRLGTIPALNRAVLVAVLGLTVSACNNDGISADLGGADYTGPGPQTETTETPPPDDDTRGTTETGGTGATGATGGTGATGAIGSSSGGPTGPADGTATATGSGSGGTGSGGTSSGGG